jgi:hypothetical protein
MDYHPDFTCLVCGEEIPKLWKMFKNGNWAGDVYDTSKDNYFVRLDKSKNLEERYKKMAETDFEIDKSNLEKEIERVDKEKFRRVLRKELSPKIDERVKYRISSFNDFLYWFREYFREGIPQPRYSISSPCMKTVLKNSERLGKAKYFIESGNEKILRCKVKMNENMFSKTFHSLSDNFNLNFLDSSDDYMVFEMIHFSEVPLHEDAFL